MPTHSIHRRIAFENTVSASPAPEAEADHQNGGQQKAAGRLFFCLNIVASFRLMASVYTMRDKISAKKNLTRNLTPSAIICYNEEKTQFLCAEKWKNKDAPAPFGGRGRASLREDIARKLRLSGYEVDACADGEAALELLAAERYDLVLLDLNLPKVDGMTVLRTLRRARP